MIRQVKAYRLLEGARGSPPADIAAIEECLIRLGQLVADFDRIVELDINPLIAGPAAGRQRGGRRADQAISSQLSAISSQQGKRAAET